MIIAPVNDGGVMTPVSTLPTNPGTLTYDGANYQLAGYDDYFKPVPTAPGVSNLWSGNVQLTRDWFGIHASGYPYVGKDTLPSCSAVRIHDWNPGGNPALWWRLIQPTPTTWVWTYADTFVNSVTAAGKEIHWILGPQTPSWASARPTENSAYGIGGGMAAEPANIADFVNYCTVLATRYRGKIKYYEVWNEVNLAGFWTGTLAKLGELVVAASAAIKAADPDALIVGPSIAAVDDGPTGGAVSTWLVPLYALPDGHGGIVADWIDIISVHSYPVRGGKPDAWCYLPTQGLRVRENIGVLYPTKPIIDTEFGMSGFPINEQGAYGQRLLARRMVLMAAYGVSKAYFYDTWNTRAAFMRDGGRRTLVTWERMQELLCTKPVTNINWVNREFVAATIGGSNYLF